MDAEELVCQLIFQLPDPGIIGKQSFLQMQDHLVIAALDIINAVQRNGLVPVGRLDEERTGIRLPGLFCKDPLHGPGKYLRKALLIHRLEQVLEGVYVKCVIDIFLIPGHKNDEGLQKCVRVPDPPCQLHAVPGKALRRMLGFCFTESVWLLGHFNIQKEKVGPCPARKIFSERRILCDFGLMGDALLLYQRSQIMSYIRFVITNRYFDHRKSFVCCSRFRQPG